MNQLIYGIIIGLLIGFLIGQYTGQPVSEGFQTTANDSVPEMNPATSCATMEILNQAFLTRIQNNSSLNSTSGSSAEIASRQETFK